MAEKLNQSNELLKAEVPINITSELKETFDSVNKPMKKPIRRKQLVLMTDASFRSSGSAVMIEDNPGQNVQSNRKTYLPVAFKLK